MHRFFVTYYALSQGMTVELDELHHQLSRVLRMQSGDEILLLDGLGREYLTRLHAIDSSRATGEVLDERIASGEPATHVSLYQCALKGDRFEWVLQKGTELGVSRFVPVISERTIVRPADRLLQKYDRWRAILREAAEQSGRGLLPDLASPMSWDDAVQEAEGTRLVPWEQGQAIPGLLQVVHEIEPVTGLRDRMNLLIGPEGGISEPEMKLAVANGWQAVTLGPRILRAETASLAAVAVAMAALGEMR